MNPTFPTTIEAVAAAEADFAAGAEGDIEEGCLKCGGQGAVRLSEPSELRDEDCFGELDRWVLRCRGEAA